MQVAWTRSQPMKMQNIKPVDSHFRAIIFNHYCAFGKGHMGHKRFSLGHWVVDMATNTVSQGAERRQLEPRAMDVLERLCRSPGEVVTASDLLDACWGNVDSGDNPVHKTITQLRRALGDSSTAPTYIETIRKRGYRILAEVKADGEAGSGSWVHTTPFRGLQAFEEQHAPIFFGRGQAIELLLDSVHRQAGAGCALVLVLGPSGAGKTSLIRAGLLPRLCGGTPERPVSCVLHLNCADIGEMTLFQALGSTLLDAETAAGARVFPGASGATLACALVRDAGPVAAMLAQQLPRLGLALCIDHFEGIFRMQHIGEDERQRFVAALEVLARSGSVLLLLACRNDFYPHIAAYPALLALKQRGGHFDVNPPNRSELAQIVRQPARAARIEFEVDAATGTGLDEVLCDAISAAGHDTLPLLQYCLQELYLQRGSDGTLSYAVFHALGGIEGAIGARAEQLVEALTPVQSAALSGVLARLVRVAEDELAVTSRRAPWSSLHSAAEQELVKVLVEARLFVSGLHGGVPAFGIAHEAILRRWPRVVEWIEQHRQTLQLRTRTSAQAARWYASGRSRDLLLPPGMQVNQALTLLAQPEFPLGPQERAFIGASVQRVRRGERLRLLVLTVVLALAGLAAILGLSARHAQQLAELRRTEAEGLMGFMLGEFIDKLRPLGRLDLLDSVSARALTYLSKARDGDTGRTALTQRAQALQVIAEVAMARADPAGATAALKAARVILDQQLAATPNDTSVLKGLGNNAFWLGQMQFDQHAWSQARAHMREYLQFSERLGSVDPDSHAAWIEQSYAHNSLGSIALESGDVEAATRAFEASVMLKTRVLARTPNDKSVAVDLADSLSWSASAKEKLGELDAAGQLYERELAIVLALHTAAPGDALYARRLANAHVHQGELRLILGQVDAARAHFEQAERLLRSISVKDPSNKAWQLTLGTVRLKLLDLDAEKATPAAQQALLQQLHDTLAALGVLQPKNVHLQVLISSLAQRQAAQYLRQRDIGRARALLARAIGALTALRALAPGDPLVRGGLVDALLFKSDMEHAGGAPQQALEACLSAQALLQPVAVSRDHHVLAPWVRAHVCAGKDQQVLQQRALLWKMAYREPVYMRNVGPTH
jgi:DNA-binding winged helix-turn-helix (wHTH) protein/tetratricopeptide (TPR) repeat protein